MNIIDTSFQKVLPLADVDFSHSPILNYLFGVLNLHRNENVANWIISNFMNPCIDIELPDHDIENYYVVYEEFFRQDLWYSCPFIDSTSIKQDLLPKHYKSTFSSLAQYAIDRGYYLYADINRHFIKNYNCDENYAHNLLIYGYNQEKELLNIADYFKNAQFSKETCTFDELNNAFYELKLVRAAEYYGEINLFKYKDENKYNFNLYEIYIKLSDYLNCTNLIDKYHYSYFAYEFRNKNSLFFGLDYYNALKRILQEGKELSPKAMQLLVVHKNIMHERLIRLKELGIANDGLINENKNLLRESTIIRNNIVKEWIKNNSHIIKNKEKCNKLTQLISNLHYKDYLFTKKVLNNFNKVLEGSTVLRN